MKTAPTAVALAVLASLSWPAAAEGQLDLSVRVSPRVGVLASQGPLYDRLDLNLGDFLAAGSVAEMDDAVTLGVAVRLESPTLGLGLRAAADRTVCLTARGRTFETVLRGGPWPFPTATPWDVSAAVTELSLELVLPTRLEVGGAAPYVSVGSGLRSYDFGAPPGGRPEEHPFPTEGTALSFVVGGGVDVRVAGRAVDVSVLDSMSRYWGEAHHQLRVAVGVAAWGRAGDA